MKISLWSDLHLEWYKDFPTWKNPGTDVLVLSGDICLAEHIYRNPYDAHKDVIRKDDRIHNAIRYRNFFKHINSEWNHVIYIMGNHEHYDGNWKRTEQVLREELTYYPNIHLLEQNKIIIDDVVFLGASLWTDMNKDDPITIMSIRNQINDYKAIADYHVGSGWERLNPRTTINKYYETVAWLKHMLSEDKRKTVVTTHHTPSHQSVHESYRGQWIMNGAFANNLDEFIMDHPHIALWTHGHVHNQFDYMIDNTRVVCNPRGYPGERNVFDHTFIIDI